MKKLTLIALKLTLIALATAAVGQTVLHHVKRSPRMRDALTEASQEAPANLIRVPLMRQGLNYTCGPAVLASMLYYYDQSKDFLEDELAKMLRANEQDGTLVADMVRVSEAEGFTVTTYYNWNLEALKASIDNGTPVIVLLQAWAEKVPGHDYKTDWENGHFAIVVGYDKKNLYFMDPSTFGNYTFIPIKQFLDRWHDMDGQERVQNFGMTVTKEKSWYSPEKIFKME